jgi:hypothetical protein
MAKVQCGSRTAIPLTTFKIRIVAPVRESYT